MTVRYGLPTEALPDEIIDAIEKSEVPPGQQHLDAKLEGWQSLVAPNLRMEAGSEQ